MARPSLRRRRFRSSFRMDPLRVLVSIRTSTSASHGLVANFKRSRGPAAFFDTAGLFSWNRRFVDQSALASYHRETGEATRADQIADWREIVFCGPAGI